MARGSPIFLQVQLQQNTTGFGFQLGLHYNAYLVHLHLSCDFSASVFFCLLFTAVVSREHLLCLLSRAVVLESGLGLESGLETFFYHLGLVLDSLVIGLGLVSDLFIGLAKCSSWSRPSPAIYDFFLFQNKTINLALLFRKRVT